MPSITHTLTAPTDRFVQALTTGLRDWWATDADLGEQSHTLRFVKGDRTVVMKFRVDSVTPDRVQWTCTENANPIWPGTTLTWTRTDDGVHFEHAGFAEDKSPPFQMTVDGWNHFAASLTAYLESGEGQPW